VNKGDLMTFVCEYEFSRPDLRNPKYACTEIDLYAHILEDWKQPDFNHRLSIRKNLETQEFEVYRFFLRSRKEEVVFSSKSLEEVVDFGNNEIRKYREHEGWLKVCKHKWPEKGLFCKAPGR